MPNPSKRRRERRHRIHARIRQRVRGQNGKPRLCVAFTGKHIYAQVIDDTAGKTLAAVATTQEALKGAKPNIAGAAKLGQALAAKASGKGITSVVFAPIGKFPAGQKPPKKAAGSKRRAWISSGL